MAYTQASKRAVQKYSEKMYDQIKFVVPKGKREEYKEQAAEHGMSLNAYIVKLLEADKQQED